MEGETVGHVPQPEKLNTIKVTEKVVLKKDDNHSEQWEAATVLSRGGKASGMNPGYFDIQVNDSSKNLRSCHTKADAWRQMQS